MDSYRSINRELTQTNLKLKQEKANLLRLLMEKDEELLKLRGEIGRMRSHFTNYFHMNISGINKLIEVFNLFGIGDASKKKIVENSSLNPINGSINLNTSTSNSQQNITPLITITPCISQDNSIVRSPAPPQPRRAIDLSPLHEDFNDDIEEQDNYYFDREDIIPPQSPPPHHMGTIVEESIGDVSLTLLGSAQHHSHQRSFITPPKLRDCSITLLRNHNSSLSPSSTPLFINQYSANSFVGCAQYSLRSEKDQVPGHVTVTRGPSKRNENKNSNKRPLEEDIRNDAAGADDDSTRIRRSLRSKSPVKSIEKNGISASSTPQARFNRTNGINDISSISFSGTGPIENVKSAALSSHCTSATATSTTKLNSQESDLSEAQISGVVNTGRPKRRKDETTSYKLVPLNVKLRRPATGTTPPRKTRAKKKK